MIQLSVSNSNSKMGNIKSVSLPRKITCPKDAPCTNSCYVKHFDWYKNVDRAYSRNLKLWKTDPVGFELQVKAAAYGVFYFRWHVSGDIPDARYLEMMCRIASELYRTTFLAFTKQYAIVNEYIKSGNTIPQNLKILFSEWPGYKMDNPYKFPVAYIKFKNGTCNAPKNAHNCEGRCEECAYVGRNCWVAKSGDSIILFEH